MPQIMRFCWIWGLWLFCLQIPLPAQLPDAEQQRLADGLYARGLYDLALVEYEKLVQTQPAPENLDLLYYRAGESALKTGKAALARGYFAEAVRLNARGLPAQRARYRLADEAFRADDFDTAEKELRNLMALELSPSMAVPVRFTLGQVLESRSQPAEARQVYRALVSDYPREPLSAYAALRLAAMSDEGVEEKRAAFENALKHPPSRDFEVEALWGLAALEVSEKNHREAADLYWRLWENFQDSTRVRGGMIHLAWAQLQAGEYVRALTLAENTSEARKQPDADTWLYLEALGHLHSGRQVQAETLLIRLMSEYPKSRFRSTAAYELAVIHAAAGAHEKLLGLRGDLEQVPGREVEALWMLAESSRALAQNRQALQLYSRIAHQYPNSPRAADALYFRALLLLQTGEPVQAAEALSQFATRFAQDPRAASALTQAGDLLVQSGKSAEGLAIWIKTLETHADAPPTLWYKTAMLEIRLEKNGAARERLEHLLKRELDAATAAGSHYWLGVLYDKQGEDAKAQSALTAALEGKLNPEWVVPARMRLGQLFVRNSQPDKALSVFLPLMEGAQAETLSDSLLMWLLPVAREQGDLPALAKIAGAMVSEKRQAVTRELGYYAMAEALTEPAQIPARTEALEKGLGFQSGSQEAAAAHLQLAGVYLEARNFEKAFAQYGAATRIASELELGRLQAAGMLGSGGVRAAEGKWEEAARYFMSVAVLFDDPELSPQALQKAADAFRRAGDPDKAAAAENELQSRYPPAAGVTP